MSDMFMWGALLGFVCRAGAARAAIRPFTERPWQYPKYMMFFGLGFYYFDWTRRVALEDLCKNEEKIDLSRRRQLLAQLEVGEEMSDAFKQEFQDVIVKDKI